MRFNAFKEASLGFLARFLARWAIVAKQIQAPVTFDGQAILDMAKRLFVIQAGHERRIDRFRKTLARRNEVVAELKRLHDEDVGAERHLADIFGNADAKRIKELEAQLEGTLDAGVTICKLSERIADLESQLAEKNETPAEAVDVPKQDPVERLQRLKHWLPYGVYDIVDFVVVEFERLQRQVRRFQSRVSYRDERIAELESQLAATQSERDELRSAEYKALEHANKLQVELESRQEKDDETPNREEIPAGVWWCDSDEDFEDFCSAEQTKGFYPSMSPEFFKKWYPRRDEFPTSPDGAKRQQSVEPLVLGPIIRDIGDLSQVALDDLREHVAESVDAAEKQRDTSGPMLKICEPLTPFDNFLVTSVALLIIGVILVGIVCVCEWINRL